MFTISLSTLPSFLPPKTNTNTFLYLPFITAVAYYSPLYRVDAQPIILFYYSGFFSHSKLYTLPNIWM